jgi:hypothetical protein
MQERFPALLLVVTNAESVEYWHAQLPASEIDDEQRIVKRNRHWDGLFMFVVIGLFSFLAYKGATPTPESQRLQAGTDIAAPPAFDPRANPPNQAQLKQYVPLPQFQPGPDALPGNYTVEFEVFLDAGGKVTGVNKLKDSTLAGFDEAVEASLRAAKPFPPQTARIFTISMVAKIGPTSPVPRRPGATTQV